VTTSRMTGAGVPRYAVLIKTLYREAALFAAIESHKRHLPEGEFRLYIADDGPVTELKAAVYEQLRSDGHVVMELPHDTGANAARNKLLDALQAEEYILRADDDFCLTPQSDIPGLAAILRDEPTLGAIAGLERQMGDGRGVLTGEISHRQGFMEWRKGGKHLVLRYRDLDEFRYKEAHGIRYALCDFTRNLLLMKREVFDSVRWDERLRFANEHEDFLLSLRRAGWQLAFSPDSVHEHREDLPSEYQQQYQQVKGRFGRRDKASAQRFFVEKWGVHRISGTCSFRLGLRRHLRRIRAHGIPWYMRQEVQRRVVRRVGSAESRLDHARDT
jgi:GT2 family glycosyltransferase